MERVRYVPDSNWYGLDVLTIEVNDLGHKGAGGERTTQKEILVSIEPVNDSPILRDVPVNLTAYEDTTLEIPEIYFEDEDLMTEHDGNLSPLFELSVQVQHGELDSSDEDAMLINSEIQFKVKNEFRVVATKEIVNRILRSLTYRGDLNFNTDDLSREESLRIKVRDVTDNDGHVLETSEILQDEVVIPLYVLAVNDLPTLYVPDTQIVLINGLQVNVLGEEIEDDGITVQLSVSNEHSTLNFLEHHLDVNVTTLNNRTVTLSSFTVEPLNEMLRKLTYTRTTRFEGGDTISMKVNENHVTTMDIFVNNRRDEEENSVAVPVLKNLIPTQGMSGTKIVLDLEQDLEDV